MPTAISIPAPAVCWACGSSLTSSLLLCTECSKVQPATAGSPDYFQVFGLDRKLNLDRASLEREFHRLSRRLHPDRFARATTEEQEWSLANTALLNDAYRTLRDPIQRVEYLLKLEGFEIGEESIQKDKSAACRQPPTDLLEEVFELNMQLEEMRMNTKMGSDDPVLQADLAVARGRFEEMLAEVDSDLVTQSSSWDAGDATARNLSATQLAALLDRRRYLRNLVRDVNEVLSNSTTVPPEKHA